MVEYSKELQFRCHHEPPALRGFPFCSSPSGVVGAFTLQWSDYDCRSYFRNKMTLLRVSLPGLLNAIDPPLSCQNRCAQEFVHFRYELAF
jgi:hypothetical protein